MSKQRLLDAINSDTISNEELSTLRTIARNNPYSQVIHALIAKAAYQNGDANAQTDLHIAAMYATDRQVLKSLITKGKPVEKVAKKTPVKSEKKTPAKPQKSEEKIASSPKQHFTSNYKESEGEKLREEVLHNLELLMDSKRPYLSDEPEESPAIKEKAPKTKKTTARKSVKTTKNKKTEKTKTAPPAKAKKEASEKIKKKSPTKKTTKTKEESTKPSTIKARKKVTESKSNKIKEQIELIDKFIQKQPSIKVDKAATKQDDKDQVDLSKPSADFGEDLISENLAEILVGQGKKDKAIDIYKKLIWKFPQKKAYFATQIEELKK